LADKRIRHLLSKKSWNVYSPANRARVAEDEALAEAAARDAEKKRRDEESGLRISLLQQRVGDGPREIEAPEVPVATITEQDALLVAATKGLGKSLSSGNKKRKRLAGEDDTDRDIRHAVDRGHGVGKDGDEKLGLVKLRPTKNKEIDAPITDSKGNINLFPIAKPNHGRKSEMDMEKARRKQMEENTGMHLADAAGRKNPKDPWYLKKDSSMKDAVGKDEWRNEDARRLQRDPLAFMKQAQARLKDVQSERQGRDLELERIRRREDREFENFSLVPRSDTGQEDRSKRRRGHGRERSRSREKSRRDNHHEWRRSPGERDNETRRYEKRSIRRHGEEKEQRHREKESTSRRPNPPEDRRHSSRYSH
jgi:hypothetical protein